MKKGRKRKKTRPRRTQTRSKEKVIVHSTRNKAKEKKKHGSETQTGLILSNVLHATCHLSHRENLKEEGHIKQICICRRQKGLEKKEKWSEF